MFFGWLVKDSILSHYFFREMGLDISASNIWVTPSRLKMDQFRIKNPDDYRLRTAFSAKKVNAEYTFQGIREEPSYIDQIVFDDATITIECFDQDCTDNNWNQLASNQSTHSRDFIIDRVVFQNLTVEVLISQNGHTPKKLKTIPYLILTQVSSGQGFPIQTIIQKAFESAELQRYSQRFPGVVSKESARSRSRGYSWKENY